MKKRYFAIILCMITFFALLIQPLSVGATEATEQETDVVTEAVAEAESVTVEASALPDEGEETAEGEHTIFTRVYEFASEHSAEVLSVAGSGLLLVLNLVLKHVNTKSTRSITKELVTIKGDTLQTLGSQAAVVQTVNSMIEGYNKLAEEYRELKEAYDTYGAADGERNRVVGALVAQNTAILEILTTVYANSKNLPQGVKDLVNLKYANCLKTLENDSQLAAIVEAVRTNISATAESLATTEAEATSSAEV